MAKDKQKLPTVSGEAAVAGATPVPSKGKKVFKKKKTKKNISSGIIHVKATFNNTIITITDMRGNVISWSSAGSKGFKGSRKSTPFAAQIAGDDVARKAMENGLKTAIAYVQGSGSGREAALRAVSAAGVKITRIQDVTPIPHNGCRPPKKRRV